MDKKWILIIVVGILIVFAGVQAVQLTNIKSTSSGTGNVVSGVTGDSNQKEDAPSTPPNVPTMVGGC